ncbi:MAG: hypothetical protein AAF529_22165 [Pseudomonadota bacterium]
MPYFDYVKSLGGWRFGVTHDLVYEDGLPYLERWIIWFGFTIRVHCFHKGDDDRAFHDHPWWFVTIPLRPYQELTPDGQEQTLKRFRPQYRSAYHRHIVRLIQPGPVWTVILTGPKSKEWGFWRGEDFVHHSEWIDAEPTSNVESL